jgi:hypothetical protein
LEDKLKEKPKYCPYCEAEMKFGYIGSGWHLFWGEEIYAFGGIKTNIIHLAGPLAAVDQVPSMICQCCGIIISQYR